MIDATNEVLIGEAVDLLQAPGVEQGDVLLVHYRALRPVEDGLIGVIEALSRAVGPDGTLVMPSYRRR